MKSKTQTAQEIIARTVSGSGFKTVEFVQYIELEKGVVPDKILGCFIANVEKPEALKYEVPERSRYYVPVKGSFEIHAWYSCNHDHETAVGKTTVAYHENIPILKRCGRPVGPVAASAKLDEDPIVADLKLEENKIRVEAVLKISAEVIGDSRLVVEIAE